MKRFLLFLFAAVTMLGSAGCSDGGYGGGGSKDFDFNGTWEVTARVVTTNDPVAYPVGSALSFNVAIVQSGASLALTVVGRPDEVWSGTCDPRGRTFEARTPVATNADTLSGYALDGDTMIGDYVIDANDGRGLLNVRSTFTMELVQR